MENANSSQNYVFNLTQGTHTLQIGHGELNARADVLFITNNPNETPTSSPDVTPTYGITIFTQLATDWLKTITSPADITKDGVVDSRDLAIMMNNWKP